MSKIAELLQSFPIIDDGTFPSRLDGVFVFQETKHIPKRQTVYRPSICIVVQGHKIAYLGREKFRYDPNHYLVVSVAMPMEYETFASPEEPVRGLVIDIDLGQLRDLIGRIDLVTEIGNGGDRSLPRGVGPAVMDEDMLNAMTRLIKCLQSETEAEILGPALVREVLYWALCGTQASVLHSLAMYSDTFSQVARVLNSIQNDYAEKLNVEQLAKAAHMSVSAFHRAFKDITSDSPLQYLKKIRLTKARDFMMQKKMKAYIAADKVGYESPSQFSREFKRYFGQSPADLMRELRS
ncbi:AraC family transcriptional regulator [Desulfobacter vibrioformis]|uniref:AraC family transcriptional regulator n=1 Tax=Desulfobacter vibrioformis TaxID=34031 RepID=UPI000557A018|nr:AraC family transcriptional regulator [Desulfobacter vibrioformis]